MIYSHSYEDPDTGQLVDVMVEDDGDEYRNARRERPGSPRDHRSQSGGRRYTTPPPRHSSHSSRPYGGMYGGGMYGGPLVNRDYGQQSLPPQRPPVVHNPPAQPVGFEHGQYISIKKSALAEIIPSLGHLWAAFLGMPAAPQAVGEDKVDRDNAALHRSALAQHQQNQTRILALTDLASRAVKLFAS